MIILKRKSQMFDKEKRVIEMVKKILKKLNQLILRIDYVGQRKTTEES